MKSLYKDGTSCKELILVVLQEIGALTPAATAILAYAFMGRLEKPLAYAALVPLMLGIMIATGYEPSFHSIGFTAAVCGCTARAFKTVLQVLQISLSVWVTHILYPAST